MHALNTVVYHCALLLGTRDGSYPIARSRPAKASSHLDVGHAWLRQQPGQSDSATSCLLYLPSVAKPLTASRRGLMSTCRLGSFLSSS